MNIKETHRKNREDIRGIFLKTYPDFIFRDKPKLGTGEIPVFVFHSVIQNNFEEQLRYLADNNYKTANSEHLYDLLVGNKKPEEKTIALTFDDGLGSLWTTAFPLLKKYGFVGISFLIPSLIENNNEYYPNLEDFWRGKNSVETILKREKISPLCSWTEIKKMHDSGVIDFQSHSFFHCSVFVNDKLVDFVNPEFKPSFLENSLNPMVHRNGKERLIGQVDLGFPIYKWDANLSAENRYLENEMVSDACVQFVKENGGVDFFNLPNWRIKLKNHWENSCSKFEKEKKFQSLEGRKIDLREDLTESKREIERKLDKDVRHLCYPWYKGNEDSVHISKEVGYKSNYWGLVKGRAINVIGDDPFYIRRLNEQYIFSLPGHGRKSLYAVLGSKVRSLLKN